MEEVFVAGFGDELVKIAEGGKAGKILKALGIGAAGAGAGATGATLYAGKKRKERRKQFREFMKDRRALVGGGPAGGIRFLVSRRKKERPGEAGKAFHKHLLR